MKKPLVSICIPTHNRLEFLKKSLQSALDQTYPNIEIVISDNSTNEDTKKYITSLKNKEIRYFYDPKKSTSFLNVHYPVTVARGDYIKWLPDDDLIYPDCVEKMVNILDEYPSVGVVMAPLKIIDGNDNPAIPYFYFFRRMKYLYKYKNKDTYVKQSEAMNDYLTNMYPCAVPTGFMFRRNLYQDPDPKFQFIGDIDLCMNFATKTDFYYIDEFLSAWRYSPSSETVAVLHSKGSDSDVFYRITKKYLKFAESPQKAFFFASKRTTLNIIAGIRSKNPKLIIETIKTILYNDPYILNKLYLPFDILFEVLKSFIPYEKKR